MSGKKVRLTAIVLAAGKGTRMKSPLPKVLHPVGGEPMLQRVISSLKNVGVSEIRVVVGYGKELVESLVEPQGGICFLQESQNGTGDALRSAALDTLEGQVLILNGDHPLINSADLNAIIDSHCQTQTDLSVVTAELNEPGNYGRIVRQGEELKAIVEANDASAEVLKIKEINTGIYLAKAGILQKYLGKIEKNDKKGEFYLTDIVSLCVDAGEKVAALKTSYRLAVGVNSQRELAEVTKILFREKIDRLMDEGVTVIDPANTYVEENVKVGPGTVLYPGVFLKGKTQIGSRCLIEPHCHFVDAILGDGVVIRAGSYFESVEIANEATIGPYARLRPGTIIGEQAHIGNFVEMKKVKFGKGAKAGHLTYLGDAEIGEETNIGCGTITCNFAPDEKKYQTIIGDNVFVGSDTQFVAPIKVGAGAIVASGSTITKDIPENALAVARGKQINIDGYRDRLESQKK